MSAFEMSEEFFGQLANELAGRCFSRNHIQYHNIGQFIGLSLEWGNSPTFGEIEAKATEKAQELYNANVKAVNQRYNDAEIAGFVKPATGFVKWSDVQLHKHLSCLNYQMAEGDVYESPIYNALEKLTLRIAQTLLTETEGWQKAAWNYQDATHEVINA